jgi:hypothetical protein
VYTPIRWTELPASNTSATPISAANLNHMERGIIRTHVAALTAAERDALTGEALFTGRMIYNRTVERLEVYTATPPVSPAGFNTPGWFRVPMLHDVMEAGRTDQTILGVKTFAQPIGGQTQFVGAKAFLPNTRAVPANTFVELAWDGEEFDTRGIFNPIADPTRMIVPIPGHYEISCSLRWTNSAAGPFDINIRSNDGALLHVDILYPDSGPAFEATQKTRIVVLLQVGSFIEVHVRARRESSNILAGRENSNLSVRLLGAY